MAVLVWVPITFEEADVWAAWLTVLGFLDEVAIHPNNPVNIPWSFDRLIRLSCLAYRMACVSCTISRFFSTDFPSCVCTGILCHFLGGSSVSDYARLAPRTT